MILSLSCWEKVFCYLYAIPKEQAKDENYQVQFYNSIWKNK